MPKATRKIILLIIILNLGLYIFNQGLFNIFLPTPYINIDYFLLESQWCVYLLTGIILFIVSRKNKKIYSSKHTLIYIIILFALAILINPWIQNKLQKANYNAMQRGIVINAIKADSQQIQTLNFDIYSPTFMPNGFTLSDWSVTDPVDNMSKPQNIVLRYEPPNGDEIEGSPVDIISFTEYKDDNILNSQTCEPLKQSDPDWPELTNACLFLVTPGGIRVYAKYPVGEQGPFLLSELNKDELDNLFAVTIAFKIGSTIITSPELDLKGINENKASITPDDLVKIVDSFTIATPKDILKKVSIQDRINNIPNNFLPN